MVTKLKEVQTQALQLDKNYTNFLNDIKNRLKKAQIRAALAANSELIKFYWQLGCDLIEKQKAFKWGDQFLEQFSQDMRKTFPELQGFSKRNLEYMRNFFSLYPKLDFAKQTVSQLPWGHIVRLIQTHHHKTVAHKAGYT
jgi:predicted nuclease of restriction endonuclease-like (RecB) superfamily